MARLDITVTDITEAGVYQTPTTGAADGHMFLNDGSRTFVLLKNNGAGTRQATLQTPQQIGSLDVEESVISLNAGETKLVGPLKSATYNKPAGDPDAGKVYIDSDPTNPTDVDISVYKVPAS